MGIVSNLTNIFGSWLGQQIAPYINDAMGLRGRELSNYYSGNHRPQLKIKQDKQTGKEIDDNIYQNFVGLAVDRSVSRLFGSGLEWTLPKGAKAQQEYLDRVWELNKKAITLHQFGLHGAYYGTAYIKIRPDMMIDPYTDTLYPSLVVIDPEIVRIETDPQDMTEVTGYRIEYVTHEIREGREADIVHIEIIRHSKDGDYRDESGEVMETPDTWQIEEYEKVGSAPIELVRLETFPYNFPPLVHCKNLPRLKSQYGTSDIEGVINIQDKSNFVVSNETKIVKFHAHPEMVGTGFSVGDMSAMDTAVGTFRAIPNADAKVYAIEMQSDLASSRNLSNALRQSIFDISREVDISSMADKLGQLTNFGLQVLWSDAIDKNDTKRQLYGDAILELNRRLLVMAGFEKEKSNPGTLQWGESLPVNIIEEMNADKQALDMGVVDKETVAKRYEARYGVDWETIQANIAAQKESENQNNDNIGGMILRNFNRGGGQQTPRNNQQLQERM